MAAEVSIAPVLEQYSGLGPIRRVHALANAGGFSGSMLWRLEREVGDICLRRWPGEYSGERLASIHDALQHFGGKGLTCVPVPLRSQNGKTFVVEGEHYWELAPWMPGKADFRDNPSRQRLASVLMVVAQLHRVAEATFPRCRETSPTFLSRRNQLERLMAGEIEQLAAAVESRAGEPLRSIGRCLLAHFRRRAPAAAAKMREVSKVPLFPVIRDLWHDHVLLSGDHVTGIVDFGAMQVDSVACDLSRLLQSLVGMDRAAWEFARQSYNSIRPLSTNEWKLAQTLDEANVILAGLNWFDWICVQGRKFENYDVIYTRLDEMLARLEESRDPPPA